MTDEQRKVLTAYCLGGGAAHAQVQDDLDTEMSLLDRVRDLAGFTCGREFQAGLCEVLVELFPEELN